jgi:hypothetical protein
MDLVVAKAERPSKNNYRPNHATNYSAAIEFAKNTSESSQNTDPYA